jgi:hypothetical protein
MYRKETRAGSIRTTLRKLSMPISCPTTFPSPPFFSAQLYVKLACSGDHYQRTKIGLGSLGARFFGWLEREGRRFANRSGSGTELQ